MSNIEWVARRRHNRSLVLVLVPAVSVLLLVGCTSSGSDASPSTSAPTPVTVVNGVAAAPSANGTGQLQVLQQAFLDVVAKVRPEVVEVATKSDLGSGVV
jgi:hypothetical protein